MHGRDLCHNDDSTMICMLNVAMQSNHITKVQKERGPTILNLLVSMGKRRKVARATMQKQGKE